MPDNSNQSGKSNTTQQSQLTHSNTFSTSSQGKRKRKRNRGKRNPALAPKKFQAPVKEYVSKCCSVAAKKPRTGTSTGTRSEGSGKKVTIDPTQVKGLSGWRCGACGKACKVTPQAPKPKEDAPVETHV
jgi:hypothetical protein